MSCTYLDATAVRFFLNVRTRRRLTGRLVGQIRVSRAATLHKNHKTMRNLHDKKALTFYMEYKIRFPCCVVLYMQRVLSM